MTHAIDEAAQLRADLAACREERDRWKDKFATALDAAKRLRACLLREWHPMCSCGAVKALDFGLNCRNCEERHLLDATAWLIRLDIADEGSVD